MKSLQSRNVYGVGVFGGVVLLVMALLLAYISTAAIGQRHYTALLEHTAGLRVGESVQVAGVSVGDVTSVELDGQQVRVGFTVDKDIRLGGKSSASVEVLTLLGTHFLAVTPSGSGTLADGTIPRARTSVPYNLQDVIEAAGGAIDELDSTKISESLTVMADALRGTSDVGRRALVGVSRLSQVAAERSDEMLALLKSTRSVTGRLSANRDEIIDLMKQSNLILEELVSRRAAITQVLQDSRRLADAISGVIDKNDKDLTKLMTNFTSTFELLQERDKGLTDSIDGLATTARYFSNALGNGPWLDLKVPSVIPDNLFCLNPASEDCE